jgi:hypothetical protein
VLTVGVAGTPGVDTVAVVQLKDVVVAEAELCGSTAIEPTAANERRRPLNFIWSPL